MEDTLRGATPRTARTLQFVLILVLMEDTLRARSVAGFQRGKQRVLILVLMEDTLRGACSRVLIVSTGS